jgi:hypothetical protein
MGYQSADGSNGSGVLGALLALLHGPEEPPRTIEATYRIWRHQPRLHGAFIANVERRKARGSSATLYSTSDDKPEPDEVEETVRIWRDGPKVRVEQHGGTRDGYYAIADPPLWWMWDERMGARSNQDDPSVGSSVGQELELMLNPPPLLSSLRFRVTGASEVAGRPTMSAHATPRPEDPRFGSVGLSQLGLGADYYELEVDIERGLVLASTAFRNAQPFYSTTALAIRFDEPITPELFRFEPPEGEKIEPVRGAGARMRSVTLVEAQQQTPFTVLMPESVPTDWQVQCRLIEASKRLESSTQIGLSYHSTDGHESVSITQMAADATSARRRASNQEGWETVTQNGVTLRTRPASWGQAQAELEIDGTWVHVMSDNLTRDQIVKIAAGLRPAPTTSSV